MTNIERFEEFFAGTGVEVYEFDPKSGLVTLRNDGREMTIMAAAGEKLKIQIERMK